MTLLSFIAKLTSILLLAWMHQSTAASTEMIINPQSISEVTISESYGKIARDFSLSPDNKYVYTAGEETGFCIFDISDINDGKVVHCEDFKSLGPSSVNTVYGNGELLGVLDRYQGLRFYNVSQSSQIQLLSFYPLRAELQMFVALPDFSYGFTLGNVQPSAESYKFHLFGNGRYMSIANGNAGAQIVDLKTKNNLLVRYQSYIKGGTMDFFVCNDQKTAILIEFYYGLFVTDISALYSSDTSVITLTWTPVYQFPQYLISLGMSSDGNHIIVGARSVGMYLFSIENQAVSLIEKIPGDHLCNRIIFTWDNDDAYMLVANGVSIVVYQRSEPNFNKDFPNFFSSFQSSASIIGTTPVPWKIVPFKDNKRVAIALSNEAMKVFDVSDPYQPTVLATVPPVGYSYDGLYLSKDENTIYIGASQGGIYCYDISSFPTFSLLSRHVPISAAAQYNDSDDIHFDGTDTLGFISNGFYGVQYVDYSDKSIPKVLASYSNVGFKGSYEKSVVSGDGQYIYAACRDKGVAAFFYNAVAKNLTQTDFLYKMGTEELVFSADEKYIFSANGFSGFLIIDVSTRGKLNLIKQIILEGWAQSITLLYNENYVIIGHQEKGQLSLINVQDKINSYVTAKYQHRTENAISITLTTDQKSLLIIGKMGLRHLPLVIDLTIHIQQRLVHIDTSTNVETYSQIAKNTSFKVGQTVQLTFVPVKTAKEVFISSVQYYEDFELKTIPFWMKYVQLTNQLTLSIDKVATLTEQGINTIVLQAYIQIEASDFLLSSIITSGLATRIVQRLISNNIINSSTQYLKDTFDPILDFSLDIYDTTTYKAEDYTATNAQIQMHIKKVLLKSFYSYPVKFQVESSLKLTINPASSTSPFIESSSNYVYIYITILNQAGHFVERVYQGALVSFTSDKYTVKLEGPLDGVNQILHSHLKIATTQNSSDIDISITLQDSANYDIIRTEKLSELQFISLHSAVQSSKSLQEIVNQQYDGGALYVEEKFNLKVTNGAFTHPDSQTVLSYTVFILTEKGEWEEFNSLTWISFDSNDLSFQGSKTKEFLWTTETIKIIATDSFTSAEDQFTITFSRIPVLLLITYAIQIIAPIIGLFGILRYRSKIYMIVAKSQYLYSTQHVKIGQFYHKQVLIVKSYTIEATMLWDKLNQSDKQVIQSTLKIYKDLNNLNVDSIMNSLKLIFLENKHLYNHIEELEFSKSNSRLYQVIRSYVINLLIKMDPQTSQALSFLKKIESQKHSEKDWYIDCYTSQNKENEIAKLLSASVSPINDNQIQISNIGTANKNYNAFPEIHIKESYIKDVISMKKDIYNKVDFFLLREALIYEIHGINRNSVNRLNPSQGSSIYLSPNEISSIRAFQSISGFCTCLRRKLALNYWPIGLNHNDPLPVWLNCKIKDDVLHIWGTPQVEDVGRILIRIFDIYDFGIMQFELVVEEAIETQSFDVFLNSQINRRVSMRIPDKSLLKDKLKQDNSPFMKASMNASKDPFGESPVMKSVKPTERLTIPDSDTKRAGDTKGELDDSERNNSIDFNAEKVHGSQINVKHQQGLKFVSPFSQEEICSNVHLKQTPRRI